MNDTLWRSFTAWKTPQILMPDGTARFLKTQPYFWMSAENPDGSVLPERCTGAPDARWAQPDFDDDDWSQTRGPIGPAYRAKQWNAPALTMWEAGSPAQVNTLYARAKFTVADPAAAGPLALSLTYRGGITVFVNGKEVARANLPDGPLSPTALATPYADDLYADSDGKPIEGVAHAKSTPEELARFAKRDRRLETVLPAAALRKGVNVLAIQIHRAPIKDIYQTEPREYRNKMFRHWPLPWPHARLIEATLTAEPGAAVTPNLGRPAGIQLWQPHPWATVTGLDWGDPCERPARIRLIAMRNGTATAQLVVSSTEAIRGLRAVAGDLRGPGPARIPSEHVLLRYPEPDGNRFDTLFPSPPPEITLRRYQASRGAPVEHVAMQPVWVTVRIPADAVPGEYRGTVRIAAEGLPETELALSVKAHGWRQPEPAGLMAFNNIWQSHESVAARYKVPLWSDRHFELMGESLALSAPLANKFCNVHLIAGAFCIGNTQSMVRWIEKGDGTYDYDFQVFDRYLDLYNRILGKPAVLMLDVYAPMHSQHRPKDGSNPFAVTLLDPATGATSRLSQPPYHSPEAVAFWKPVLQAVQKRLEQRGWWDVAVIGTASDSGPGKGEAQTFKEIWPDRSWHFSGHPFRKTVGGDVAPVRSLEWVWGIRHWNPPVAAPAGEQYPRPWKNKEQVSVAFSRVGSGIAELRQHYDLDAYRLNPEKALQCNLDGIGRIGIDFWQFPDERGRMRHLDFGVGTGQFYFTTSIVWMNGPGPDGPLPTTRSELFREGLQVREAMTFLQKAADGGTLAPELVARIHDLLWERGLAMVSSDGHRHWQANEDRLFDLCAKAAQVLNRMN